MTNSGVTYRQNRLPPIVVRFTGEHPKSWHIQGVKQKENTLRCNCYLHSDFREMS